MSKDDGARRSELLFCYDVRMANPNGDPDENRPRIDPVTKKNLVTDFRLKRTIRDYLQQQYPEKYKIFIRAEADAAGNLKQIEDLAENYIQKTDEKIKVGKKEVKKMIVDRRSLIKDHIDIRLFGILFAVNIEKQNISFKQVGPVQFAIGQSLNPVEEVPIRITRVVPTRAELKAGTFGEKSILRYSFIAFRGFVNDVVGKETGLTENEVETMLKAMWFGTNALSTTSKYGQQSRLLLRLCYKEPHTYIGDLDRCISLNQDEMKIEPSKLEDIRQLVLNVDDLFNLLTKNVGEIDEIQYASSDNLMCSWKGEIGTFSKHLSKWYEKEGKPKKIVLSKIV